MYLGLAENLSRIDCAIILNKYKENFPPQKSELKNAWISLKSNGNQRKTRCSRRGGRFLYPFDRSHMMISELGFQKLLNKFQVNLVQ